MIGQEHLHKDKVYQETIFKYFIENSHEKKNFWNKSGRQELMKWWCGVIKGGMIFTNKIRRSHLGTGDDNPSNCWPSNERQRWGAVLRSVATGITWEWTTCTSENKIYCNVWLTFWVTISLEYLYIDFNTKDNFFVICLQQIEHRDHYFGVITYLTLFWFTLFIADLFNVLVFSF